MAQQFNTIGIIGRHRNYKITDNVGDLIAYLGKRDKTIIIDEETARSLPEKCDLEQCPRPQLGAHCDLVIVVGGDGCFLSAARAVARHHTPVIGINRGRLGFLTDILPNQLEQQLDDVFNGDYSEEQRFLLHCDIIDEDNNMIADSEALNDIVLMPGDTAQMIEFNVTVDDQFVYQQRADGIIIATPTGSTAYALSAGGPILHPQLNAIVLVPMFPHNMSSRPIAISGDSVIRLTMEQSNTSSPRLSCDSHARIPVPPGAQVKITKLPEQLCLIHPNGYNFYETLRSKLGWENTHR